MGKMVLSYSRDENISRENRICGSAGIGRQARLRILCWLQRVGSSPIFRSNYECDKYSRNAVFIVFFCSGAEKSCNTQQPPTPPVTVTGNAGGCKDSSVLPLFVFYSSGTFNSQPAKILFGSAIRSLFKATISATLQPHFPEMPQRVSPFFTM